MFLFINIIPGKGIPLQKASLYIQFKRLEQGLFLQWVKAGRWMRPRREAAAWQQKQMAEILGAFQGIRGE